MDNSITEYSTLMDMLFCTDQFELWMVASSKTLFLNTYITSKRNRVKNAALKSLDDSFNLQEEVNIIRIMRSSLFAIKSR